MEIEGWQRRRTTSQTRTDRTPLKGPKPISLLSIAAGFLVAAAVGAQQPAETLPGFQPQSTLEARGIDNVNLYSGDPGIVIPLGPEYSLGPGSSWGLKAYYSAKFWHFDEILCSTTSGPQPVRHALVTGHPTVGIGWSVNVGTVALDTSPFFNTSYYSPDGGRHAVTIPSGQTTGITEDGTRLRITKDLGTGYYKVEFPDGMVHRFDWKFQAPRDVNRVSPDFTDRDWGFAPLDRWGLTSIEDSFGNQLLTVTYLAAYGNPNAWKIDRVKFLKPVGYTGTREIVFYWTTSGVAPNPVWTVVDYLELPGTGGQTLKIDFNQAAVSFDRNPYDRSNNSTIVSTCRSGALVNVPQLNSITFSHQGGTSFTPFSYSFAHYPSAPLQMRNGVLTTLTLPTGGTISYEYLSTVISPGLEGPDVEGCQPAAPAAPEAGSLPYHPFQHFWDRSLAVSRRTEFDPVTNLSSETSYSRNHYVSRFTDPAYAIRKVIVTSPGGNGTGQLVTRHLFYTSLNPSSFDFVSGIELQRRHYAVGDTECGVPVRTLVFCYEKDGSSRRCGYKEGGTTQIHGGSQRQAEVTWYGENPISGSGACASGSCAITERSSYHSVSREYRVTTSRSTLASSMTRTINMDWRPVTTASKWLLDIYWSRKETTGGVLVERYADFDTDVDGDPAVTGFLRGTATYDRPAGKVLWSCRYNTLQNGTPTTDFVATATLTGDPPLNICQTVRPTMPTDVIGRNQDAFGRAHTYQNGMTTSTTWLLSRAVGDPRGPGNDSVGWSSFDVTRDSRTTLVTSSRDTAGVSTSYSYDALGRLTAITPTTTSTAPEAATAIAYPDTKTTTVSRGGISERYQYDGLGRLIREIRQIPGGYAARVRAYDQASHNHFVSEWGSCSSETGNCQSISPAGTTSSAYDPFGRAGTLFKADGSQTTIAYDNTDSVKTVTARNLCIGISCASGSQAVIQYRYENLGRLVSVTEPKPADGTAGGDLTSYAYDGNDNLTSVVQGSQGRTFTYDKRGFLISEQTPEKGFVSYTSYGGLGNLRHKDEAGGVGISYLYEAGGRLACEIPGAQPADSATCDQFASSLLTRNYYDEGGRGSSLGKLTRRIGENWGWGSVTESFFYSGLNGRANQKDSHVSGSPQGTLVATQNWTYNSLGLLATHTHPRIGADGLLTATYSYSAGLPVSLITNERSLVSAATYSPAGALKSWTAGNGVVTTITQDTSGIPRPTQISTTGSIGSSFNSGIFSYDGAGNIKQIGSDGLAYDGLGRLTRSTVYVSGTPYTKNYAYDRWGNRSEALNNGSNRLWAGAYDPRGNLTGLGPDWFGYDALSRQTAFNGGRERYVYDGAGERVARIAGTTGGAKLFTIAPCRVMDTRNINGPYGGPALQANSSRNFKVVGTCGIPANALAIVGNLTAASPGGSGHFSLYPAGAYNTTSTLNFNAGQTRANNFRAGLSGSGEVSIFAGTTTTHAILDVVGYYAYPASQWILTFRDDANRLSTDYLSNPFGRPRLKDYFYFGNVLVATRDGAANYLYYASDHLGTPRLTTNQTATAVEGYFYHPFGEEICCGFGNHAVKFAAMERDQSSLKDYVHARYLGSFEGRFLSPDKVGGTVRNPQTWNRYSYALNNPLKFFDPDGREVRYADDRSRVLFTALAGRYSAVRATLDRYSGPGKPDLFIMRGDAGRDPLDGKKAFGVFKASIEPSYKRSDGSYTVSDPAGRDQLPTTGKNLTGATLKSGTLTIDTSATPGTKQESSTAVHELGHAESAARDPQNYLVQGADDVVKPDGQPLPHDQRPLEAEANQYRDQVCGKNRACQPNR